MPETPSFSADVAGKQIYVSDLRAKDVVRTTFLVRHKAVQYSKNGKAYVALVLADRTGTIEGRIWEDAVRLADTFSDGVVVAVSGRVHLFQDKLQINVENVVSLPNDNIDLAEFLPRTEHDVEALYNELLEKFRSLEDPWVRSLGLALLEDREIASRYKLCPAAKTIHHAFLGGLLVHSLQLIKLVEAILPYYPGLSRDVLIFGAAFHDFGKIYELSYESSFGYTDVGKLVGHITIGAILIDRKIQAIPGFPTDLELHCKHMVLSHHGHLEYGSPKRPATLEAQLLHHLDDMDSKLNSIETMMINEKNGSRWTGMHRAYDQSYFKPERFQKNT